MIQFTAQELADFIEAIRFQAKKEMEPVNENKVKVGESVKPNYEYIDHKAGEAIESKDCNGKIKIANNPKFTNPIFRPQDFTKFDFAITANNMTDEEIDKANDEANAKMDGAMFSDKTLLDDDSKRIYPSDISDAHRMLDECRDEIIALKKDFEGLKEVSLAQDSNLKRYREELKRVDDEAKSLRKQRDYEVQRVRSLLYIINNLPTTQYIFSKASDDSGVHYLEIKTGPGTTTKLDGMSREEVLMKMIETVSVTRTN